MAPLWGSLSPRDVMPEGRQEEGRQLLQVTLGGLMWERMGMTQGANTPTCGIRYGGKIKKIQWSTLQCNRAFIAVLGKEGSREKSRIVATDFLCLLAVGRDSEHQPCCRSRHQTWGCVIRGEQDLKG